MCKSLYLLILVTFKYYFCTLTLQIIPNQYYTFFWGTEWRPEVLRDSLLFKQTDRWLFCRQHFRHTCDCCVRSQITMTKSDALVEGCRDAEWENGRKIKYNLIGLTEKNTMMGTTPPPLNNGSLGEPSNLKIGNFSDFFGHPTLSSWLFT